MTSHGSRRATALFAGIAGILLVQTAANAQSVPMQPDLQAFPASDIAIEPDGAGGSFIRYRPLESTCEACHGGWQ